MIKVKYSEKNSNSLQDKIEDLKDDIREVSNKFNGFVQHSDSESDKWRFKYANSSYIRSENNVIGYDEDDNPLTEVFYYANNIPGYFPNGSRDYNIISDGIQQYIESKINEYKSYRSMANESIANVLDECTLKTNKLLALLNAIANAINTFEETGISLKDSLAKISAETGLSLDGLSFDNVTLEDGTTVEQVMFTYKDENGQDITITLAEAVNTLYTYYGTATSSSIAYELLYDAMGLSSSERDRYRTQALLDTAGYVDTLSQKGLFQIASLDNINNFYSAIVGDSNSLSGEISQDYESILGQLSNRISEEKYSDVLGEIFGIGTNASLAGGMIMAAGVLNNNDFALASGIISIAQDENNEEEQKTVPQNPVTPEEKVDDEQPEEVIWETAKVEEVEDANAENTEVSEENNEDDILTDSEEQLEDVEMKAIELTEVNNEEIPELLSVNETLTSEDIDRMAEEQFFDQFTDEGLAEYRQGHVEEFDSLFAKEDKSELIEFFEKAGYSEADATKIAEDRALGMTAYLAAKQTADMTDISNNLANSNNMDMNTFDTVYDDAPTYDDLLAGETNAFIANPNESDMVNNAKQAMDAARDNYETAVDNANTMINQANNDKEVLDNVRNEITARAGENPSDWSEEDVERYNNAVDNYNNSVQLAKENVTTANDMKETYEETKNAYDEAKEEYYQQIKESIITQRSEDESLSDSSLVTENDNYPNNNEENEDIVVDDNSLGVDIGDKELDDSFNRNIEIDGPFKEIDSELESAKRPPDAGLQPVLPEISTQNTGDVIDSETSLGF